jgi:hypothetical protein
MSVQYMPIVERDSIPVRRYILRCFPVAEGEVPTDLFIGDDLIRGCSVWAAC